MAGILPSQVETREPFVHSAFGDFSREAVARQLVIAAQFTAWVTGVDKWPLFTERDYEAFRRETNEPVDFIERRVFDDLISDGFIEYTGKNTDILQVTDPFLEVVSQFRVDQAVATT